MTSIDTATHVREHERLAWTRIATGRDDVTLVRASVDAGFRTYWRATVDDGDSCIVMDSPRDLEDVRPWLRIHALLEGGGVRVPRILAQDVERGFLLLEDFGARTYLQILDADNAAAEMDAAVTQLLRLQAIPVSADLPDCDEALLTRDLRLFDEWFLGRHLGVVLDDGERDGMARAFRLLIESALAQPQVLVHRDFMPRNLMPADDGPAVIDFQGAVRGPVAYDAMSLFKDAFLSWPEARVDAWLDRYHARAVDAGVPVPARERFRRDADLAGAHRHLKILGIFARLHHRDDKPKYLADAPRFLAYLDGALPKYPELTPLTEIVDRHVRPALARPSALGPRPSHS
jgi:hypothetical protein